MSFCVHSLTDYVSWIEVPKCLVGFAGHMVWWTEEPRPPQTREVIHICRDTGRSVFHAVLAHVQA